MAWHSPITGRLYIRIWLVVASSVAVVSLVVGMAWYYSEQARLGHPSICLITVRSANGALVDSTTEPVRHMTGGGLEFKVASDKNGQHSWIEVRPHQHDDLNAAWQSCLQPPSGFWWILLLTGGVVMVSVFPLARQLARRVETLHRGLQRWGKGDLSIRFSESGNDEIADLARYFNAAADRIAALIASQKSLLDHASHELCSPLARLRMAVELVPKQPDTIGQNMRAEILRNVNELDEIIGEILLARRLEIGTELYDAEPVDLVGLLAEECVRTDATLNVAPDIIANPACCVVQGSALLLRHAVRNLLENAVRHGKRADGTCETSALLEFESAESNAAILIHVDDRGPGVSADQYPRLFEPFYRVPGAHPQGKGFGLGLSLVRIIAERYGGSVSCRARTGGGMRFTLRLARRAALPPA